MRHLELLREIAARGTLAAVAEATHRSPSAVSQQLRAAERELGVRLVEPASRSVRLTPEGELLAHGAVEIGERLAALGARLDAARGAPTGEVSIGTLPSAGQALLPGLLSRMQGTELELRLDDFDLAEADFAARAHDADIVLAHSIDSEGPRGAEGLVVTRIVDEPLVAAVPAEHPVAACESVGPEAAGEVPWIGVPEGYPFDAVLIAMENSLGRALERRIRLRDNRLVERLVSAGLGAALLPGFTTAPVPGMVLRPVTGVRARRMIVALSRSERHARLAVAAVTRMLVKSGRDLGVTRSGQPCLHYTGPTDVVTIRFHCCGRWYACLHCHEEAEMHAITAWPRGLREAVALRCRVCGRRFSIAEYLGTRECRGCGAMFNPGCAAHHPVYFET